MALTSATANSLISVLESVVNETDPPDPCPILCEARKIICADPNLGPQCATITAMCNEAGCDCGGTSS